MVAQTGALGCWLTFPIGVDYGFSKSLTCNNNDDFFALVEHPGRVGYVRHRVVSSQLG